MAVLRGIFLVSLSLVLRNQWLSCLQSWNGWRFYLFFWKKAREVTTLSLLFLDFFAGAR